MIPSKDKTDIPLEDAAVSEALISGDREVLEVVYQRYSTTVMAAALMVTRNRDSAEDVVQEVFLRLWRQPDRYDPSRGSLRTFLAVDARGRALDLIRSEGSRRNREDREATLDSSTPTDGTEDQVMATLLSTDIRRVISRLRPTEREAIALAYLEGHSYREVARRLGEPEGTVKSRIRIGLERLGTLLEEDGIADEHR